MINLQWMPDSKNISCQNIKHNKKNMAKTQKHENSFTTLK
jgi:hypothetical protein